MYTQGLDSLGKDSLQAPAPQQAELEARFQQRIDADEKIEAKDWMPRRTGRRSSARSPSTRTPRSSACFRRATGSRARPA